jgi:Ni/Fe-hydrogenase 1 B-type cytochrome subunit
MGFQDYYRVYVWELPVRIFHWINFLCILALTITGFLIADPPALMSGAEANDQYWFGTVRYVHFVAAYIFTFNFIYRLIWGFVGNKYIRWKAFWPFTKQRWHNLMCTLRVDILLRKPVDEHAHMMSVGHNQLAYSSYIFFYVLCIVQVFTGFALYADTSSWWFPQLFEWFKVVMGGDINTRILHHVVMWLMIIFTVVHVYLVLFHDWLEGRGIISSMFGGYKFIKRERLEKSK